jgi:hypothetical protein
LKTLSSQFSTLDQSKLREIPPLGISSILKNEFFQIENEDFLYDFLIEYRFKWGSSSIYLFENIYFEHLTLTKIDDFVSEIPFSSFCSTVFESFSFLFKQSKRIISEHRYSSSPTEFNNLFTLKAKSNSLKTPPLLIELFRTLRLECNNQNPHNAGIVEITASSVYYNYLPQNILDFGTDNYWYSKNEPNQWILFNLKGKQFQIKQIRIHVNYLYIPKHWILEGSNDNSNWTQIHDQGEDERCKTANSTVTYDINSPSSFSYFRICQLSQNYYSPPNNYFTLYSVEFIGYFTSN